MKNSLEYAHQGLIAVLTPQGNTTVEPEFSILLPPGYAMLAARLVSPHASMTHRLADYLDAPERHFNQFGGAPIGAYAFAVTGSSYLIGRTAEAALVDRLTETLAAPVLTAARALTAALNTLGATRIGLVSPYGPDLRDHSRAYWRDQGFEIAHEVAVEQSAGAFHAIYGITSANAAAALAEISTDGVDAVLLLGTGMPSLPVLHRAPAKLPVLSSNLALAWQAVASIDRREPDREDLMTWLAGTAWAARLTGAAATTP